MAKKIFYDLETTGLLYLKHGIHQLSGCVEIDGHYKEHFNFKIQPPPSIEITAEALEIGGVTPEILKTYEPEWLVFSNFKHVLARYVDKYNKKDKFFLVGYNNRDFDDRFLREMFTRDGDTFFGSWFWANTIDVMVLASEHLLEQRASMLNFKLHTVAATLGIPIDESKLHDALYDIVLTRKIYNQLKINNIL